MMLKKGFFIALLLISSLIFSQKSQRIAYIDMDYILENVPEYVEAQQRLDEKVKIWKGKLDKLRDEIEQMRTELENEKALLTDEMIREREEDIDIKKKELDRLQIAYFGTNGDLYRLRKQFVQPVQDIVFNAIQSIAKRKRYDFVFDKSSDLIMLYYNKDYDISELVLNTIVKNRKRKVIEDRKKGNKAKQRRPASVVESLEAQPTVSDNTEAVSAEEAEGTEEAAAAADPEAVKIEEAKKRQAEKEAKRAALKARIKAQQEAREKLRDSLKRESERRRQEKLKEIERRKKEREELLKKTKNN